MPSQRESQFGLVCDYCDLPAAYALCVERACEAHASAQLKETVAMEMRNASRGWFDGREMMEAETKSTPRRVNGRGHGTGGKS